MKKAALTCLAIASVIFSMAQNLTKVKDAIEANKYAEANKMLDEFINNPKYQKNAELHFLKGSLFSKITGDENALKSFPDAFNISLNSFKKCAEIDKNNFKVFHTLDGKPVWSIYANPYNKGIKDLNEKQYQSALEQFQLAETAGLFIYGQGLGLTALPDTNLLWYAGIVALQIDKEDVAKDYFTKLANINIADKGFEEVYRNLMRYHFNKNNLTEFEKIRLQGLKLYPNDEFFTYDEVVFINDIKDDAEKLKRIEDKVNRDPQNKDAISTLAEILFDKLLQADSLYPTEAAYTAAETKVVKLYEALSNLSPEDGAIPFNTGLIYINKGFMINNKISDVNDKIRKFNDAQKPDKTGKIPPPPKELTASREDLRAKQQVAFDMGIPYLLKAQPLMEKKIGAGRVEMQNYKKLVDILIEVYSSKRQATKVAADKAKFEAEEAKWNKEYERINNMGK